MLLEIFPMNWDGAVLEHVAEFTTVTTFRRQASVLHIDSNRVSSSVSNNDRQRRKSLISTFTFVSPKWNGSNLEFSVCNGSPMPLAITLIPSKEYSCGGTFLSTAHVGAVTKSCNSKEAPGVQGRAVKAQLSTCQ